MAENTVRVERVVDSPFVLDVCGTLYPLGHRYLARTAARVAPEDVDALVADGLTADLRVTLLPDPKEPWALITLVE